MDAESYAHETINVATDALRQITITSSLDGARQIAQNALDHLNMRRTALIARSELNTGNSA